MAEQIAEFEGEYRFLSNFWKSEVEFEGILYPSSEHAYQAAKAVDDCVRRQYLAAAVTLRKAKQLGKKLPLRGDWDEVKQDVMLRVVRDKFTRNADLGTKLVQTGDAELIEGNYWHDTYWGVCKGEGTNHLGQILMKVREELNHE